MAQHEVMGCREGVEPLLEGGEGALRRRHVVERLARDALHHGEHVLHPMVQFLDHQFAPRLAVGGLGLVENQGKEPTRAIGAARPREAAFHDVAHRFVVPAHAIVQLIASARRKDAVERRHGGGAVVGVKPRPDRVEAERRRRLGQPEEFPRAGVEVRAVR